MKVNTENRQDPAHAGRMRLDDLERRWPIDEMDEPFRQIFDKGQFGIVIIRPDLSFAAANPAFCELIGYTEAELAEMTFETLTHPDDLERNVQQLADMRENGETRGHFEKRCITRTGDVIWVNVRISAVRSPQGELLYSIGMLEHITETRRTEQALHQANQELFSSEAKLRAVLESAPDGIVVADAKGVVVMANDSVEQLFGRTAGDLLGRYLQELIPVEFSGALQATPSPTREPMFTSVERLDGRSIPTTISSNSVRVGAEELNVVVIRDMTAIRTGIESHLQLSAIVEASKDAIYRLSPERRIQSWSKGAEQIFGYTEEEAVGMDSVALIPADKVIETHSISDVFERGQELQLPDTVRLTKDGESVNVSSSIYPIRNEDGDIVAAGVIARDITEQKWLEEQFQHAERLGAIGRLAGGVAHDFNNILTVIEGYAELLRLGAGEDKCANTYVDALLQASSRAAKITRQLLSFSGKQRADPRVIDPRATISDLGKMLRYVLGSDVDLSLLLNSTGMIKIDPAQLEQVVMNLSVNARDAMPSGGKLQITVSDAEAGQEGDCSSGRCSCPSVSGRYVKLTISDNGAGMTRETMSQVFDPFFTTKARGKGTGLGLATVYGIVQQCGGAVCLDSDPGTGTTFVISLPQVEGTTSVAPVKSEQRSEIRGNGKILVVEDESEIRNLTVDLLATQGYTVISAPNAEEASRIFDREPDFDLLVSDVVMSGLSVDELVSRCRQSAPNLKVLYMSGCTEALPVLNGSREAFLEKPFAPSDLLVQIADLLGERRGERPESRMNSGSGSPHLIDYRTVVEESSIPIFRTTFGGQVLYVNRAAAQILGYASAEELMSEGSSVFAESGLESLVTEATQGNGRIQGAEIAMKRGDGQAAWVAFHGRISEGARGSSGYFEGAFVDVSERRSWEADLARTVGHLNRLAHRESMPRAERFRDLTRRETEILYALIDGGRVNTIARELTLSPNTVRQHLKSVFRKLDVRSQEELVRRFRSQV